MNVQEEYEKMYVNTGFERSGLFECVGKIRGYERVAYIGSSIHLAPAFYFKNVAFIDTSGLASRFFSDMSAITAYVESRKTYAGSPRLEHVDHNYETGMDDRKNSYDLVICLYAPHSLEAAVGLSRIHGTIVYLPLPSDNDLATEKRVTIIGRVKFNKRGYYFDGRAAAEKPKKPRRSRNVFREANEYYVLERCT